MTYSEVIKISKDYLLPAVFRMYNLNGYIATPIEPHCGGRNVIYTCEKADESPQILRICYLDDRTRDDFLAELEYVRFLHDNGASVANVISSVNDKLLEEINYNNHTFFISLFQKAKGKMLVENNYCYRDGVPLTEYFYNCGKVLGKMHQLSKNYKPIHRRYSFFDKFNMQYINELIPNSFSVLKEKLKNIINTLEEIEKNDDTFGMIHFDYNDGNYNIDFDNGQITVYDFDNSCFGFYMYDLSSLWMHGTGWIQFEKDVDKRKKFMDDYFSTIIDGYKSQTDLKDSMLEYLQLFIQADIMESIVDGFEVARNNNEECYSSDELSYLIKCLVDNIPYRGFFDKIYSCEAPFEYEE